MKKNVLGRGLDALIPSPSLSPASAPSEYVQCDIDDLHPNQAQPRMHFSVEELEELTQSIQEQGIIQPLLVRKNNLGYEVIAGERRLRAARRAGLQRVPVVIREVSDAEVLELSLIENLQRQDLNPLEEAEAYHRLLTEHDLTQADIAERVGKKRPTIANMLRLRQLPEPVKQAIRENELGMGHARALLGADTPAVLNTVWQAIMTKGLSVRQTEVLVNRLNRQKQRSKPRPNPTLEHHLQSLAEDLSRNFGTQVQIKRKGKKGQILIDFFSDEDLDRLLERLKGASA